MISLDKAIFSDAIYVFLGIVLEAFPFILIGVISSSLVHIYLKRDFIIKYLPKNKYLSMLLGPIIGIIFPVCECGNIPLARKLASMNMSPQLILAFLFSAPIVNPIVIISTLVAFNYDIKVVLLRVGFGLFVAFFIAIAFGGINKKELYSDNILDEEKGSCCHKTCTHNHHKESNNKKTGFFQNSVNEFIEIGGLLVIGAIIASLIQAVFSRDLITSFGIGPISSILSMQGLAIITSICSNVDAFFALAYSQTFSMGSILAFLVLGPMIDIKSFFMLRKIFKTKIIIFMSILIIEMTFLLTLVYNYYFS